MLFSLCFASANSNADNSSNTMTVKPNRCIALQQGHTCYATLSFQWAAPVSGEYCLYDEHKSDPIICWVGSALMDYKHEFASDKNVIYDVRLKINQQSLSQTLVKISWVYKSNTKSTSRWRLF